MGLQDAAKAQEAASKEGRAAEEAKAAAEDKKDDKKDDKKVGLPLSPVMRVTWIIWHVACALFRVDWRN